jgi:hypothetical protein
MSWRQSRLVSLCIQGARLDNIGLIFAKKGRAIQRDLLETDRVSRFDGEGCLFDCELDLAAEVVSGSRSERLTAVWRQALYFCACRTGCYSP